MNVEKQIEDAIDALIIAAFTEGGCSEHRVAEARIQTELREKELRALLSSAQSVELAATQPAAKSTAPQELVDAANKVGRWLQIAPHDKESTEAIDDAICLLVDHVVLNAGVESRFREALTSIQRYGFDTLSGRADGADDRNWQRQAVREMTRRATDALAAQAKQGGA